MSFNPTYLIAQIENNTQLEIARKLRGKPMPNTWVRDWVYCVWEADGEILTINPIDNPKYAERSGPTRKVSFDEMLLHIFGDPACKTYRVGDKYGDYTVVKVGKIAMGIAKDNHVVGFMVVEGKEITEEELRVLTKDA